MLTMAGYTKLFHSILASTIWLANDKTRIVWITLLAMADKNGIAEGSVPGIASFARVSLKDCQRALTELQAPDEHSRTPDHDGRRIAPVDGGFQILNHAKYRAQHPRAGKRPHGDTPGNPRPPAPLHERADSIDTGVYWLRNHATRFTPMRNASSCNASPSLWTVRSSIPSPISELYE